MYKINPKIDLVFKKLFGTEENKDILLSLDFIRKYFYEQQNRFFLFRQASFLQS